jgi:hypothetical protein
MLVDLCDDKPIRAAAALLPTVAPHVQRFFRDTKRLSFLVIVRI